MSSDLVIQTGNLSKHYGALAAVNDVSLHVKKGEIYGFLGLNGAGKTTAIRLLLGLAHPTAEKAFLKGQQIVPSKRGPWELRTAYPGSGLWSRKYHGIRACPNFHDVARTG